MYATGAVLRDGRRPSAPRRRSKQWQREQVDDAGLFMQVLAGNLGLLATRRRNDPDQADPDAAEVDEMLDHLARSAELLWLRPDLITATGYGTLIDELTGVASRTAKHTPVTADDVAVALKLWKSLKAWDT